MENKVSLYNSDDVKIGETFPRRAQQLVRQQRAMWRDDSQTSIRFAPGMENMDIPADDTGPAEQEGLAHNDLCFAPWNDNYYYPAVITDILPNIVKVAFLDGDSGQVPHEYIISVQEAFETMEFECKYGWMGYYRGSMSSYQPIIFHYYDDGVVEYAELRQLRGLLRFGFNRMY